MNKSIKMGQTLTLLTAVMAIVVGAGWAAHADEQGVTGMFTDSRDGKTYKTATIGKQTWMAENLNYATDSGSWCFIWDSNSLCDKYGRLYNWNTAKVVCPMGWRLPRRQEWDALGQAVGGERRPVGDRKGKIDWYGAGTKLKAKSGWYRDTSGTDDYGFSALPGGYRYIYGTFGDAGGYGNWWTTTEDSDDHAYYRHMGYGRGKMYEDIADKRHGFSVRCVGDRSATGASSQKSARDNRYGNNHNRDTGLSIHARQPAADYDTLKANIYAQQQYFFRRYGAAPEKDRTVVLSDAQRYLVNVICDTIFPYWYDTPWSFHGTSRIPRQGTIACGYFVTTVLADAGFQIPRVKWAQVASETVIVKIAANITRFRNRPMAEVAAYVNQNGDGLYLVGLDCHVGYICKSGDTLRFVHSSYYVPEIGVMSEPLEGRNPLNDSKYRVIGKLLGDEMVKSWVMGIKY